MCGRYAASRNPDDLVEEFEVDDRPAVTLPPDFNVAPTKEVYAVLDRRPKAAEDAAEDAPEPDVRRRLEVVRWGLVPSWAKDPSIGSRMINARMETVHEKPAFRRAFAKRRCLLPADGYFEWTEPTDPDAPRGRSGKPLKQPWFIHPADGSTLAMAGLYEFWRDKGRDDDDPRAWWVTVTVITTEAEDALGRIHDRAPLIVPRERWRDWLDPDRDGSDDPESLTSLLVPATPGRLEAYPVSTDVNDVRNNGPQLLDPVEVGGSADPAALF